MMSTGEWLRKWWPLIVPVCVFLTGSGAWAAHQEEQDKQHTLAIRKLESDLRHRLERIEDKLDRLIERTR